MHLIERYSLSTGSKINKPYIYETYFPIPFSKYITFQAQSKFESKDYQYWQDCLDFLTPVLEKLGIYILQIGGPNERVCKRVVDLRGQTTLNQLAYIMKGSMLHIGPDSLGVHLASIYNIPIVGLYSIIQASVAGPYFGDKSKQILIESFKRIGNGKPSYSQQENPKSINLIKPEEIANSAFQLLNIDFSIPFETIYTGNRYSQNILREMIPNANIVVNNPDQPIEIRMDLHYDETILAHHLSYLKKAVIITNKPIQIKLLNYFKSNILSVVYKITKNDNPEFVKELIFNGLPVILISSLLEEQLNIKKLSYYEYGNINRIFSPTIEQINNIKKHIGNLYFKSCKYIGNNDKVYPSHASIEVNQTITKDNEFFPIIDSEKFWQDLEFFTIIVGKNP